MENQVKDWLGYELGRNKAHAGLYVAIVRDAISKLTGARVESLIGHHITFETGPKDGEIDIETENEIPSADCLMFDHTIMGAVFGDMAIPIMVRLASVPCEDRDALLAQFYNNGGVEA